MSTLGFVGSLLAQCVHCSVIVVRPAELFRRTDGSTLSSPCRKGPIIGHIVPILGSMFCVSSNVDLWGHFLPPLLFNHGNVCTYDWESYFSHVQDPHFLETTRLSRTAAVLMRDIRIGI
eukprot:6465510-Amphidinium_carterae.1